MARFKVGDRVRVLNTEDNRISLYPEMRPGSEHLVGKVLEGGWLQLGGHRAGCGWSPQRFELVTRKDTAKAVPSVGDTVRVVLEGKVTYVSKYGFDIADENTIAYDAQEHVKSVEIITPAKPSVVDLPVLSVVRCGPNVYVKAGEDHWYPAGCQILYSDAEIDSMDWTLLVEKGSE